MWAVCSGQGRCPSSTLEEVVLLLKHVSELLVFCIGKAVMAQPPVISLVPLVSLAFLEASSGSYFAVPSVASTCLPPGRSGGWNLMQCTVVAGVACLGLVPLALKT